MNCLPIKHNEVIDKSKNILKIIIVFIELQK